MFSLPAISYKIRADHLTQQYWSAPFVQTDVAIEVPYLVANVHVTDTGADVENAHIRVFRENGNYTGVEGYTNASGAVSLDLPAAVILKFRAEYDEVQYWLYPVTLTAHQGAITPQRKAFFVHLLHSLPALSRHHKFFDNRSFMTSTSRSRSARILLSRAFCFSSSLSRRDSLIDIPPYLLHQR